MSLKSSLTVIAIAALALCAAPFTAHAASSCSSFAVIKGYDAATKMVDIKFTKGSTTKYFPLPEGSSRGNSKLPKKCKGKVTKKKQMPVTPTGGRLTVTQVRTNFSSKMLNDPDDPKWLPAKLKELIDGKTKVFVVVRPGLKDKKLSMTTIYMPISEEEKADIKRIEEQAEDA